MNTVNSCDALLCAYSIFVPFLSENSKQIQIRSTKFITLNFSPATINACFVPVTKCTSTVNTDSTMEVEIKERIALGNKAFFANKKIFQSKLISKNAKLKLYFSVIRPVVIYACETWILKETITNRLMVFERKILRKLFGPTYENGYWRIKTNQEMDKLIKRKNIMNFARVQSLGWHCHIERMQETRMVKAIHTWKPILKRPMGRPKIRW